MARSTFLLAGWILLLLPLLVACSDKDVDAVSGADTADPSSERTASSTPATSAPDSAGMKSTTDGVQGMWQLVAFEYGEATAFNNDLDEIEVTASFSAEGAVSGRSGCNRYQASVNVADDSLTIGPIAGTKMACPGTRMEVEDAYTQALSIVSDYQREGNTLMLLDDSGTPLLRFESMVEGEEENSGSSGGSTETGGSDS